MFECHTQKKVASPMILLFNLLMIWVRFMMLLSAVKQAIKTGHKSQAVCR